MLVDKRTYIIPRFRQHGQYCGYQTSAPCMIFTERAVKAAPLKLLRFAQRTQEVMQQPDDALIVEGYGVHAPRFAGITVYATQVTMKMLQAAKRTEQTAAPVGERGVELEQ